VWLLFLLATTRLNPALFLLLLARRNSHTNVKPAMHTCQAITTTTQTTTRVVRGRSQWDLRPNTRPYFTTTKIISLKFLPQHKANFHLPHEMFTFLQPPTIKKISSDNNDAFAQ
jgi:hypothetical protein